VLVSGAGKHDKHSRQMMDSNFTEIRFFVLFNKLKNTFLTPLHLLFFLQTNKQRYRLLRLTNHSSAFQLVSGMKLNML